MTSAVSIPPQSRVLHWSLWAAQILLAVAYLGAGFMKLTMPMDGLLAMGMGFVDSFPEIGVRLIGLVEVLGAIGLIVPTATRVLPVLTLLAALGFVMLQIGAMITHGSRGEYANLPVNVVLLAVAAFIFWGRWKRIQISSRF